MKITEGIPDLLGGGLLVADGNPYPTTTDAKENLKRPDEDE